MLKLISKSTDPTSLVSIADLKTHCRIEHDVEDALISSYRLVAVTEIERLTGNNYLSAQYEECFPEFCRMLPLQQAPLVSIDSVKYYDQAGVQQTWSSTNYLAVAPSDVSGYFYIAPQGTSWVVPPTTQLRPDAVTIRYTSAKTDPLMVHLTKMLVLRYYEDREGSREIKPNSAEARLVDLLNTRTYY